MALGFGMLHRKLLCIQRIHACLSSCACGWMCVVQVWSEWVSCASVRATELFDEHIACECELNHFVNLTSFTDRLYFLRVKLYGEYVSHLIEHCLQIWPHKSISAFINCTNIRFNVVVEHFLLRQVICMHRHTALFNPILYYLRNETATVVITEVAQCFTALAYRSDRLRWRVDEWWRCYCVRCPHRHVTVAYYHKKVISIDL